MLIGIFTANAQITWNCGSFTCSVPDTNVICNTNSTCILTCTLTNTNCCSSVNCNQIIDSSFVLPMGWYVTMCNPNGCFPNTTTSNAFIIPPSGSVTAKFEIHSGSNPGGADVRVRLEDMANSSNGITFHIVGNVATGIADNTGDASIFLQNYPNPFTESTTIKYNLEQSNGKLLITDVQGKTIAEYKLNNTSGEIIVAENLKSGIYFYALYSNDKMISKNKMLIQ